jgi:hypothetical protein
VVLPPPPPPCPTAEAPVPAAANTLLLLPVLSHTRTGQGEHQVRLQDAGQVLKQ